MLWKINYQEVDMNMCNLVNTPIECGIKLLKHEKWEKADPTQYKSLVGTLHYLILQG